MGLLAISGALSGAGQAINQGLQNVQQGLLASYLQKEREAMELKRQAINHEFQTARDVTLFAHDREMQEGRQGFTSAENEKNRQADRDQTQTKIGADIVVHTQSQQAEAARQRERLDLEKELRGQDLTQRQREHADEMGWHGKKLDLEKELRGKDLAQRQQEHADELGVHGKKLDLESRRLTAEERHWEAADALAKAQSNNAIGVVTGQNGEFFAHMKDGTLKPLVNPNTNEPVIGTKGLSEATKATTAFYEKRIESLEKIANDPLTPPEQVKLVRAQIDTLSQRALALLGHKEPEPAAPIQINDRYKPTPGSEKTTPAEGEKGEKKDTPAGPSVLERAGQMFEGAKSAVSDFVGSLSSSYQDKGLPLNAEEDAKLTRQTIAREEGRTPEPDSPPPPAPRPAAPKRWWRDAARETAGQVVDGAGQVAESAKRTAGEVVEGVGQAASRAKDAVGSAVDQAAEVGRNVVKGLTAPYSVKVNPKEDAALTQETLMREDAGLHTQDMLAREGAGLTGAAATGRGALPPPMTTKPATTAQPAPADWPRQLTKVLAKDDKLALADSLDIYKKGKMTVAELRKEARGIFRRYFRPEQTDAVLDEFMVVAAQSKKRPGGR